MFHLFTQRAPNFCCGLKTKLCPLYKQLWHAARFFFATFLSQCRCFVTVFTPPQPAPMNAVVARKKSRWLRLRFVFLSKVPSWVLFVVKASLETIRFDGNAKMCISSNHRSPVVRGRILALIGVMDYQLRL